MEIDGVEAALRRIKVGKALRPDGIRPGTYKTSGRIDPEELFRVYHKLLRKQCFPAK